MHVFGSCEASAQYSPINFFVNLFHSKNSNLPHCFSDLIHTEYRKLHKNNGHSPFVSPSIMRSSVGQCRNIRFRQLSASHVIITSASVLADTPILVYCSTINPTVIGFEETFGYWSVVIRPFEKRLYNVILLVCLSLLCPCIHLSANFFISR